MLTSSRTHFHQGATCCSCTSELRARTTIHEDSFLTWRVRRGVKHDSARWVSGTQKRGLCFQVEEVFIWIEIVYEAVA